MLQQNLFLQSRTDQYPHLSLTAWHLRSVADIKNHLKSESYDFVNSKTREFWMKIYHFYYRELARLSPTNLLDYLDAI